MEVYLKHCSIRALRVKCSRLRNWVQKRLFWVLTCFRAEVRVSLLKARSSELGVEFQVWNLHVRVWGSKFKDEEIVPLQNLWYSISIHLYHSPKNYQKITKNLRCHVILTAHPISHFPDNESPNFSKISRCVQWVLSLKLLIDVLDVQFHVCSSSQSCRLFQLRFSIEFGVTKWPEDDFRALGKEKLVTLEAWFDFCNFLPHVKNFVFMVFVPHERHSISFTLESTTSLNCWRFNDLPRVSLQITLDLERNSVYSLPVSRAVSRLQEKQTRSQDADPEVPVHHRC